MCFAVSFGEGRWYSMGLGKTKGNNLLGFHGMRWVVMGQGNSAELIESERPFSVRRLWASGAQTLCGKDIFSLLWGGEPKGAGE